MWSTNRFATLHQYKALNSQSSFSSYLVHRFRLHLISLFLILNLFVAVCLIVNYRFGYYSYLTSNNDESIKPKVDYSKYLIHTAQCVITNIPPFTREALDQFVDYGNEEWKCAQPDTTEHIRRVNFTFVQIPTNLTNQKCKARQIVRRAEDEWLEWGEEWHFVENQTVMGFSDSVDAVEIKCEYVNLTKVVTLIPKKESIWFDNANPKDLKSHPNVLMIGIDSVSRLNFLRHFNKTQKFLKNRFEGPLYGLHKVGDNTWPNLIGIFTGESHEEKWAKELEKSTKMDNFSLIFKEFSKKGYLTTYGEDWPKVGLWTYYKKNGFNRQPFEYFLRPSSLAMADDLNNNFCYKEKLEYKVYYDYLLDQMEAFRERGQKFFTFTHMVRISHDWFNHPHYVDYPVHRFLTKIFDSNFHENTLIIFFSDHGLRFGEIVKSETGFHESRTPFMYFYIPESMRLRSSADIWLDSRELKKIFSENSRKLTSQFDVHATLRHVLDQFPPKDEHYGLSLFTPIPQNRTCEQAGIPDEFCLCRQFRPLNNQTELVNQLAIFTVNHLNSKLAPYHALCSDLTLDHVIKSNQIISQLNITEQNNKTVFTITIKVQPSGGLFEATLKGELVVGEKLVTNLEVLEPVLRQDRYGQQSWCVASQTVESLCYCRDNQQKESQQSIKSKLWSFIDYDFN